MMRLQLVLQERNAQPAEFIPSQPRANVVPAVFDRGRFARMRLEAHGNDNHSGV
jgi:hypothetical protein